MLLELSKKLSILADAAKYDAACTSSGHTRRGAKGTLGSAVQGGICHAFTPDGRCVSLLKILMSNSCCFDCRYCANRASGNVPRATFSPRELADLTIGFYRRNYIEGLFLSSAVVRSPDHTAEGMIAAIALLRDEYRFGGYIHAKCIPGTSRELIDALASKVDRISINIELPSAKSLSLLAPEKTKAGILEPMAYIKENIMASREERLALRHAPRFAPAGQATQMIIGATPESDREIIRLSEGLYRRFHLKRVFFSAYIPVGSHALLPRDTPPPLLREHRLYQADWLIRFYGFRADEILSHDNPNFNVHFDPKCDWALRHLDFFPVEISSADREMLLRVPGVGARSVDRILAARRLSTLSFEDLKRIGVVLKRAKYFVTCGGRAYDLFPMTPRYIADSMRADTHKRGLPFSSGEQLSLFSPIDPLVLPTQSDAFMSLQGEI